MIMKHYFKNLFKGLVAAHQSELASGVWVR